MPGIPDEPLERGAEAMPSRPSHSIEEPEAFEARAIPRLKIVGQPLVR